MQNVFVLVDASGLVLGVRLHATKAKDFVEQRPTTVDVMLQPLTRQQIETLQRNEVSRCLAAV